MMKKSAVQKFKARDLITIGICIVIIKVLNFVVMMPFTPVLTVALPYIWGVCMLVAAPVYLLMAYKVAKRGTVFLLCAVMGIFDALMGYVILIPFMLAAGILCELVVFKSGNYRNFWRVTAAYCVYSVLSLIGSYLPIYLFGNEYFAKMGFTGAMADVYAKYALSPMWVAISILVTVAFAIIGCLIGKKLLNRHFIKAGIVSASAAGGGKA